MLFIAVVFFADITVVIMRLADDYVMVSVELTVIAAAAVTLFFRRIVQLERKTYRFDPALLDDHVVVQLPVTRSILSWFVRVMLAVHHCRGHRFLSRFPGPVRLLPTPNPAATTHIHRVALATYPFLLPFHFLHDHRVEQRLLLAQYLVGDGWPAVVVHRHFDASGRVPLYGALLRQSFLCKRQTRGTARRRLGGLGGGGGSQFQSDLRRFFRPLVLVRVQPDHRPATVYDTAAATTDTVVATASACVHCGFRSSGCPPRSPG